MKIRIVSSGSGQGTKVYGPGELEIPNLIKVTISPIERDTINHAVIEMALVGLDIEAEAILSLEVLEASAAYYGLRLVPMTEDSDGALSQAGA